MRLRHRPIKQEFEHLKELKEDLCYRRLEIAMKRKSKPWNEENLDKVLSCLKAGKSRDPHQMIYEIFKPGAWSCRKRFQNIFFDNG